MALFSPTEFRFTDTLSKMIYSNPFLPDRIELERQLLGKEFTPAPWVYHLVDELDHEHPNLTHLDERVEKIATRARNRLADMVHVGDAEFAQYSDLVTYLLYRRYRTGLLDTVARGLEHPTKPAKALFWNEFATDFKHFLELPGRDSPFSQGPQYLLACFFQVRRAFYQIYHYIAGASRPAMRLRGAVWQSIFTHNMARYFELGLYNEMGRFPTLVTGPSGTGKELVARAIGLSRFIPFDPEKACFTLGFAGSFCALNISALAPGLVESELFGHAKGAFSGAFEERVGWFEDCPKLGSIFLDEIGELNPVLQVKLLRVLQYGTFNRLGETRVRQFKGMILAATNRDLATEMHAGRFREDFYYRLCGDVITTPSLAEYLGDHPEDLTHLLRLIVKRLVRVNVDELATEIEEWITNHPNMGRGYAWPGNFRELEQCAWNVLIRKEYHPPRMQEQGDPADDLANAIREGTLTADDLERQYATLVFAKTGSYQETARHLGRNWRTIKKLLQQLPDVRRGNPQLER